jgi:hypothetical protein
VQTWGHENSIWVMVREPRDLKAALKIISFFFFSLQWRPWKCNQNILAQVTELQHKLNSHTYQLSFVTVRGPTRKCKVLRCALGTSEMDFGEVGRLSDPLPAEAGTESPILHKNLAICLHETGELQRILMSLQPGSTSLCLYKSPSLSSVGTS